MQKISNIKEMLFFCKKKILDMKTFEKNSFFQKKPKKLACVLQYYLVQHMTFMNRRSSNDNFI
jgi:hypothetical protein